METRDSFVGLLGGEKYLRTKKTENYVCIPPALLITDERGDTWTLGYGYSEHNGAYYLDVMRNDQFTGEQADKVEYKGGRVRIHTCFGFKIWSGKSFI